MVREITSLENDLSTASIEILKVKERELEQFRLKRMEGVKVRSRARWVEEGEKPSRYFCNMENRHFTSKMMPKLVRTNGTIASDINEIKEETRAFYKRLYSAREVQDVDINALFNINEIPRLDTFHSDKLEGDITYDEALSVLKNMKNNKSPGSDGFTVEFFKFFWSDIGHFIVKALNNSFQLGELALTLKEGIITCIPKGDKPKQFLKNWKPVSLLNVTYKIASSCIPSRLKNVLPHLIDSDQTGFLAGRYIGENIRLLYDLMDYTSKNKIPAVLLLIDFEKAFDSVEWSFIDKVLKFYNFGDGIRKRITVFYKNTKSCVSVNGHLSEWFHLSRGCRQGDPLSPYIFLLCVEILAHMIRQSKHVKGIKINVTEYLISQYVDDTSLFFEASEKSLRTVLNLISYYAKFSGLGINIDKTRVIWLGNMKGSNRKLCEDLNQNWEQGHFTVLGVKFSVDLEEMLLLNYEDKISQIRKILQQWSKQNLNPYGKIVVIKTIALS